MRGENRQNTNYSNMNTTVASIGKSPLAFRFRNDLVVVMKDKAKKENDEKIPNATTIAAIEEARAGKCTGRIDTSSMEAFIKSSEE